MRAHNKDIVLVGRGNELKRGHFKSMTKRHNNGIYAGGGSGHANVQKTACGKR